MEIKDLKIDSIIDNKRLCDIFKCSPQGGMRRSLKTNTLVLVSDRTNIYEDKIDDGIYHYTGMGLEGDQQLTSQNKTLAESRTNGVTVHFFEVMKPRQYTYRGEVELVAEPYTEQQRDKNGNMRSVWVFPLRKVSEPMDEAWVEEIEKLEEVLTKEKDLTSTEKERMIKARIGQSTFKRKLIARECKCALCGVTDITFLRASHIKPWSQSTNQERLDVHNGLLLCPNHDALFDKGCISFDDNGQIQLSSQLDEHTRQFMNVVPSMKIDMTPEMKRYMNVHRLTIFMK